MYDRRFWVYILSNRKNGTLYIGMTNDLSRRTWEHQTDLGARFVAKHGLNKLVYAEEHATALEAIAQEKRMKRWRRAWKIDLIEKNNPAWADLSETLNA